MDLYTLKPRNIKIWSLLSFQAGAINAGGFIACNRFVTHTTGFATHFAYEFARQKYWNAVGMLTVPVFFLFGAMVTSYFVDIPQRRHEKPALRIPAILIFLCLFFAAVLGEGGAFGVFGNEMVMAKDYLFMVLLCLASGLQNAMVTNGRGISVRTTHLTGVTTDLGIGLVRLMFFGLRKIESEEEKLANIGRVAVITGFVLGSLVSAYLFIRTEYMGFVLPATTSLILLRYCWYR